MTRPSTQLFTARTLSFLRSLRRNNDREWFAANRERYERDVRQPMLAFVQRVSDVLPSFAPELVASPGTSLYRIHRDTRFSEDKSPFKTQIGAVFPHRELHRNQSACLYVEIGPAGTMIAGGIYMPDRPALVAIRAHIAETHRRLRALVEKPSFRRAVGPIDGDALQRVPRGYPPDHPAADYLKLRQFLLGRDYPAAFAASPAFWREIVRLFRLMAPVVRYLNEPLVAAIAARDPLEFASRERSRKGRSNRPLAQP